MKKNIYELDLHEGMKIADGLLVNRVPGGWIYQFWYKINPDPNDRTTVAQSIFVPYSEEFKNS